MQKHVKGKGECMEESDETPRPASGPFRMGRQGYLIVAIIIVVTAIFAATRSDWTSMMVSAIVPPLIIFPLIHLLTHGRQGEATVRDTVRGSRENVDLMTLLARTNPITFLMLGVVRRRSDDERYQQLLSSGPFGMGRKGYLVALGLILGPLILTLIIIALTGQQPAYTGPHFP